MERMKREIFSSLCFDVVKKQHENFMAFIDAKIEPVEGDIVRYTQTHHYLISFNRL